MTELLSSFPTSIFTGFLAFCLTWWIVTTVASGIDADADSGGPGHGAGAGHASGHIGHAGHGPSTGGHASGSHSGGSHSGGSHTAGSHQGHGHDSHGHGHGHGEPHHFVGKAFAIGVVPLPLALSIVAFGGWSVSLVLQYLFGHTETASLATGVGVVVLVAALVAGFLLLRALRDPIGKLFETEFAPARQQSVGATCKVRTLVVTDRLGDAEVLTGPTKGSLIKVRADEGRFTRGDVALIIDYDGSTEAFVIDDLDEMLHPD